MHRSRRSSAWCASASAPQHIVADWSGCGPIDGMHALVTGGTGFVGGHLARALLGAGHTVYVMGRDFSRSAGLIDRGAIAVPADFSDRSAMFAACEGLALDAVC